MTFPRILRPQAAREAIDASDYYEDPRKGLSVDFHRELNIVLERVAQMPEIYAVVEDDIRRARLRRFPYTVYYRIGRAHVDVIAVVHARRDRPAWRDRL